jgi:hypothetical protein
MQILCIGGTGVISLTCSDLVAARGHELFVLNRSTSKMYPYLWATLLKVTSRDERSPRLL